MFILYAFLTIASLAVGLIVFLNNPKAHINRVFLCFVLAGVFWQVANILTLVPSQNTVSFFSRLITPTSILLAAMFFYLCAEFPDKSGYSIMKKAIYFLPALMLLVLYYAGLEVISFSAANSTGDIGSYYYVFILVILFYLVNALLVLMLKYRHSTQKIKEQLRTLILAVVLSFAPAILFGAILPALGYEEVGNLAIFFPLIFVIIVSSSIIRYRLFDIRAVVARSFAYLVSIVLLATIYSFIAFRLLSIILPEETSIFSLQIIYTILAIILAFTFAPLKRFFEKVTNSIFYRDHYDQGELLYNIGQVLSSEIDLSKMSTQVIHVLQKQMKINQVEMVVFGKNQSFYLSNVFKSGGNAITKPELKMLGRGVIVADSLASGERKKLMAKYNIAVSVGLKTSEKFLGYLLLSEKRSGEIYSSLDISVLRLLGGELSVATQNALSYTEIQQFSETLAERVRQRTAQLHAVNEKLRKLDVAKDEFISMASHQLRTPLTTVKGYTSMLEEGDFGKLTEKQRVPLQMAFDGATRMSRLIDDLLNVSRMDANRFFLEVSKVHLPELVEDEVGQLQSLAKSKSVALSLDINTSRLPMIPLDENKTRQVVMNLIDNALHYSAPPTGGGEVHVTLRQTLDGVELKVIDNGIGVPKAVQRQLFTKMFRASNAKDMRPDGTGLGLYLVKRVVEDQGGKVLFESIEGKGSTFGFWLPISGVPKETIERSRKVGEKVVKSSK